MLRKEEKKEGEEKYEENETNFEGAYLRKGLVDSAQIWNWRCPTPSELANRKFFVFFCLGSVELQMCENGVFLTPVKYTHLFVARPRFLGFLGRTTHYRVS